MHGRLALALVVVTAAVFVGDCLFLWGLPHLSGEPVARHALLGSSLTSLVVFPLLYLFLGRPAEASRRSLEAEVEERRAAEAELGRYQTQLGSLVDARTRELQQERSRLLGLLDQLPEGVVFLDGRGQFLLANPAAQPHLSALRGTDDGDALTHLGGVPLDEFVGDVGEIRRREITLHDVLPRAFEITGSRITGPEEGSGSVLVLREVTQERESERRWQQQDRLAAVGQLAAGIAHDFNNILQSMLLNTELVLAKGRLEGSQRERLESVARQGERAAALIRQVLDFSRASVQSRRHFDLAETVADAVRLLRRTLPESIETFYPRPSEAQWVHADASQIQQVLLNLALNARDAMPEGGRLEFQVEGPVPRLRGSLPVPCVALRVRDTGAGIPKAVRSRVFDPFFTTKPPGKGTGLGLAQVYGIIQQHGGEIELASEEGVGTEVALFLPLAQPADGQREEIGVPEAQLPRGRRALLVEDDPAVLKSTQDGLADLGFEVVTALDGVDALAVFRKQPEAFDVVVTDVVMPRMNGLEFSRLVRESRPDIPVILASGYPRNQPDPLAPPDPSVCWLPKPFSVGQLAACLERALDGSGAPQAGRESRPPAAEAVLPCP